MSSYCIIGIDPGLVHTGLVTIHFYTSLKEMGINHQAIAGPDALAVQNTIGLITDAGAKRHTFIENYRPRRHYGTDKNMIKAVADIKAATRGKVLDNTGVKKIVTADLLKLLKLNKFSTPTHHDDLVSAARIALLGMMKEPTLNTLLADVVRDQLELAEWSISVA